MGGYVSNAPRLRHLVGTFCQTSLSQPGNIDIPSRLVENPEIVVLRSSVQHFDDLRPLLGILVRGESDSEGPRVVVSTL